MARNKSQQGGDVAGEECPFCGSTHVTWYNTRVPDGTVPWLWYVMFWGPLAWLARRWDMRNVPRWRCRACGRDWSVD